MNKETEIWLRHTINDIGLSLNIFREWPVLSMGGVGVTGIYQPINNTSGIVFVRYGVKETLKEFIGKLGDMLTSVSVISDAPLIYCKKKARRVILRMVTQSHEMYQDDIFEGMSHRLLPETRNLLFFIGFRNRGVPIIVGYRMPEEILPVYQNQLDEIINSVSIS